MSHVQCKWSKPHYKDSSGADSSSVCGIVFVTHTHTQTYTHTHTHTHTYPHIPTQTRTYAQRQTHTQIPTQTHTHAQVPSCWNFYGEKRFGHARTFSFPPSLLLSLIISHSSIHTHTTHCLISHSLIFTHTNTYTFARMHTHTLTRTRPCTHTRTPISCQDHHHIHSNHQIGVPNNVHTHVPTGLPSALLFENYPPTPPSPPAPAQCPLSTHTSCAHLSHLSGQ